MKGQGLEPDVIGYNAAISACEKGGRTDDALDLLAEMKGRGLEPNVITYNAIIKVCFDARRYAEALQRNREAVSLQLFSAVGSSGVPKWDLHSLTEATSCMLLSDALLSVVNSGEYTSDRFNDIIVVTGKGLNTVDPNGPVLKDKVPQFLGEVAGIAITAVEGNEGRFRIRRESLQEWASSAKFGQFQALFR